MALLLIEGFETYGSLTGTSLEDELIKKWGEADMSGVGGDGAIVTGRDGGKGITLAKYTSFEYIVTTDKTDWVCGFALKVNNTSARMVLNIRRRLGGGHLDLRTTAGTDLNAHLLGSGVADDTAAAVLTVGQWHYIEVKLNIHDTTGSYEVKIDGSTELSNSGVDTNNASGSTGVGIMFYNDETTGPSYDDVYICDNTGAQNNDFLGDSTIAAIDPISDVTTEWGAFGGSNHYDLLDDNPSDENTTYIETGSPTAIDLWGFENAVLFGNIYGIQINAEISSTSDAVDLRVVSGATTSDAVGTDNTVANDPSFITFTRIVELDPNTSSAWTLSNLNTAQFGVILDS